MARDLAAIASELDQVIDELGRLADAVGKAVDAIESIPDSTSIIKLVTSGQLRKLEDINNLFNIVHKLPELFKDLADSFPKVKTLMKRLESGGPLAKDVINQVLAENWFQDASKDPAAEAAARDFFSRVQNILRSSVVGPIMDAIARVQQIRNLAKALPFHSGRLELQAGVLSYDRWSDLSFDAPCSKMDRIEYNQAGVSRFCLSLTSAFN